VNKPANTLIAARREIGMGADVVIGAEGEGLFSPTGVLGAATFVKLGFAEET
jgi:hypothetical protein